MHVFAYACMFFGALLAIIGIFLFIKMGTQGKSVVKMFGFEFHLEGSALVIFVVGIVLFIIPVIYGDRLLVGRDNGGASQPSSRFAILNVYSTLMAKYGLFQTLEECKERLSSVAWSDYMLDGATCDVLPEEAFCTKVVTFKDQEWWYCHKDRYYCEEWADTLEHGEKLAGRCQVTAVNEALKLPISPY